MLRPEYRSTERPAGSNPLTTLIFASILALIAATSIAGAMSCAGSEARNPNIRVEAPTAKRAGMDRFYEVRGAVMPPQDLPAGRLVIRGSTGAVKAMQQPVVSGYQWVIDGSQITKTDDDAPWPEAAMVRPGDDIMIQLDGHHLPAVIEISVFRSLDPDHVEQEFGTDFYCYPLTGVQETCDVQILSDIRQSHQWEGVIPKPQEPGPQYLVIWAQWFDFAADHEKRPRGHYHITWRFLIYHSNGT